MTEVLRSTYIVPFHHFPPLSQDPLMFPSDTSGSFKAKAFQEVEKTPWNWWTILFWVTTVGRGVCPWSTGESERLCPPYQILGGDGLFTVGVRKGDFVPIDLRDAYSLITIHPDSWPYLQIALGGKVY